MPGTDHRYDRIGGTYSSTRMEDPRIAAQIDEALDDGPILNIGAGSGNYEPANRQVVGLEPSTEMLRQRSAGCAPVVRGLAESLPFNDHSFGTAMAVLTIHHWTDPAAGLAEMARVADRQVVFFFEQGRVHGFWAIDYFPDALCLPTEQHPPGERLLRQHLEVEAVRPVMIPHDCIDGFGTAFWARPEEYLRPEVQAGMSWLAMLTPRQRQEGTQRLRDDLESGEWDRRLGHLRHQQEFDGGYRIAIAGSHV